MLVANYQETKFLQFCQGILSNSLISPKKQQKLITQKYKIELNRDHLCYFLQQAAFQFVVYQGGFCQKSFVRENQRFRGRLWEPRIREGFELVFTKRSIELLTLGYQFHLGTLSEIPKSFTIKQPKNGDLIIGYLVKENMGNYKGEEPFWDFLHGKKTNVQSLLSKDFRLIWNYLDLFIANNLVIADELLWKEEFEKWQIGNQIRIKTWNELLDHFIKYRRFPDLAPFLRMFEILFRSPINIDDHQIKINRVVSKAKRIHIAEQMQDEIASFYHIGERLRKLYNDFQKLSYVEREEEENLYMEMYNEWYLPIEEQVTQLHRTLTRQQG